MIYPPLFGGCLEEMLLETMAKCGTGRYGPMHELLNFGGLVVWGKMFPTKTGASMIVSLQRGHV